MSKEGFSWKSLFVNDENEATGNSEETPKVETPPVDSSVKFPTEPSANPNYGASVNNPHITDILAVYEKGFESLNQTGFDFFELYKSVMAVGASNPQSYHMAFTMGKTLNAELSKEFLIEKSKYYLAEIEKVYQNYDAKGKARKNDLDMTITRDKVNLTKEVSDLESQIAELQKQLDSKRLELMNIDSSNREQFMEIQLKIEANDVAKRKIVDSINLVVSGINQYL